MKQTKTKLLCLLLAVLMLFSLTACGKEKTADSNLIKLGDYELLYKGACIMEDSDGNDAIVLTLDFTNNGTADAAELVARETGCAVFSLDTAISSVNYLSAMTQNIDTIKEALG